MGKAGESRSETKQSSLGSKRLGFSEKEILIAALTKISVTLGETISADRMIATAECLEGFPLESVVAALKAWTQIGKWFPKPAEIIEMVSGQLSIKTDNEAEASWRKMLKFVENWSPETGWYGLIPKIELTQREKLVLRSIGGLDRIFHCPVAGNDIGHIRRDYIQIWKNEAAMERINQVEKPALTSGSDNGKAGLAGEPAKQIKPSEGGTGITQ